MSKSDKTLQVRSCRICLDSKCMNTVTLDDQNGWLHIFQYCFGITLSTQDKPRNLCRQCANHVVNYSRFKELCHKSDKLWKSLTKVDEIVDHEQNGNEIFTSNEKNYIYAEQINSDLNKHDNGDNLFKVPMKNEYVNGEIITDLSKEHQVSENNDGETTLLTKDVDLRQYPQPIKKRKGLFACKLCQKKYGSKLWYLKHLKSCKSEKIEQKSADTKMEHKAGTEINIRENTKILKYWQITEKHKNFLHFCGVCKFSSNRVDDVTKHLDEHWTNNDLQCRLCEFIAKDQAAIAAHRYNHYGSKTLSFICHICQKKAKSQLTLQFHYRMVHLNKTGGLCSQPQCDKAYNSWKLWKRHEKLHTHPGYICDFCGQKYRYKHAIVEHLSNHINPTAYVCDVCGKTFIRLRNLRVHIENVHVKSDPLQCAHCDRMFKNQHYLKLHQKLLAMEKIWKCEFCPMEYPQLNLLNSHLKSHSEERPYCCHICGSRYKAKSQLAIHMRNHTGDRPYKCSLCGKAFKSAQLLRRHAMIHTGIMPHKCLHCEKTFLCKKRMIRHCTMRHKTLDKNK